MKALITGASSGIGRDIAHSLSQRGYDLILVARREERMRELADTLPTNVKIIALDLTSVDSCKVLYNKVKDEQIDILVNNAGRGLFGAFDETDMDEELDMLKLNITAMHVLMKLFVKDFKRRGSGRILNVASSAAFLPGPLLSSYYASKAYVLRLSQAVAEELRRAHSAVTVSVLCPGPVNTEFNEVAGVRFAAKGLSSKYVAEYAVQGTLEGKLVITPGIAMKAVHFAAHVLPDMLTTRVCWHMQRRKKD